MTMPSRCSSVLPQPCLWICRLRNLFDAQLHSLTLTAYHKSHNFMRQLGSEASLQNLHGLFRASQKEQERAQSRPNYSTRTRELILEFIHELGEKISLEDSLLQRAVTIFDHANVHFKECDNQLLIYHLLASFYLVYKVEMNGNGPSFDEFEEICQSLHSYQQLILVLNKGKDDLQWHTPEYPHVYAMLERSLLERVLRFKTNLVSYAEAVYLIVCTATNSLKLEQGSLDRLLHEALFRSYLCLLDFRPVDHSAALVAVACIHSSISYAKETQVRAIADFLGTLDHPDNLHKSTTKTLVDHIDRRVQEVDQTREKLQQEPREMSPNTQSETPTTKANFPYGNSTPFKEDRIISHFSPLNLRAAVFTSDSFNEDVMMTLTENLAAVEQLAAPLTLAVPKLKAQVAPPCSPVQGAFKSTSKCIKENRKSANSNLISSKTAKSHRNDKNKSVWRSDHAIAKQKKQKASPKKSQVERHLTRKSPLFRGDESDRTCRDGPLPGSTLQSSNLQMDSDLVCQESFH